MKIMHATSGPVPVSTLESGYDKGVQNGPESAANRPGPRRSATSEEVIAVAAIMPPTALSMNHSAKSLPLPGRLISKVFIAPTGCWEWQAHRDPEGYSRVKVGDKMCFGHRVSYEVFIGPIPAGLTIDHLCFTPSCINPAHLRPMTAEENSANQRSASRTHCKSGHEFTPENTYQRPTGGRDCRACGRDRVARYKAKKRGRKA